MTLVAVTEYVHKMINIYDTFRAKNSSFINKIVLYSDLPMHLHIALSPSLSLSAIDTALSEFRKSLASELLSGYISCTDCSRSSRSVFEG